MASYEYSIAGDFPQGVVGSDLLAVEISNSSIVTVFTNIDTAGDVCLVWFATSLSGPEEATLDGLVAAHQPIGAPPSVVDSRDNIIIDPSWAVFKPYINGVIANLYFYTQEFSDKYVIISDFHGGFRHQYTLPFADISDKADYDTNFAPVQDTRRPYEQLVFTEKGVTVSYAGGDIDKVETVIGDKKRIEQFNYSGGDFVGITTTIVDA